MFLMEKCRVKYSFTAKGRFILQFALVVYGLLVKGFSRYLVDAVVPGNQVTVVGVLSIKKLQKQVIVILYNSASAQCLSYVNE